jgi:hypothetical protein
MPSQDREAVSLRPAKFIQTQSAANGGRVNLQTIRREIYLRPMLDKTHLIRFKKTDLHAHLVIAANAEIHGEHLVFIRSDGSLAALFLLDVVESWSECDSSARMSRA